MRGRYSTKVAFLLLTQQPLVQFWVFPKIYFDAFINWQHWFEESGLRLEYVDQTHLILVS